MRRFLVAAVAAVALVPSAGALPGLPLQNPEFRSLDGSGNNILYPTRGQAGTQYLRVAPANYADGVSTMVSGPPTRFVSNRVFNDVGQNLFSENNVSQIGWLWGQFMDHDIGLRDERPAENAPIPFDAADPLEDFANDFGAIDFARTPAASGTGITTPRQQINTISSYIDGSGIYGVTAARLDWLRNGPVDGNPANNQATLMLFNNFLPRADARGNAATAPPTDLFGGQVANPGRAVVAGDVRANENMALTAMHTVFAREHNRIVAALPATLTQEQRFQIARRVVGAELQFITYNEFLPNLGVQLAPYHGYDPGANSSLRNEFATVGYRAHSMIHGEMEPTAPAGTWSAAQLAAFEQEGIEVEQEGGQTTLVIPLSLTFGNPDLLEQVGPGPLLRGLADEAQYKNDEQIDNSLRSVLFEVPKPGVDPSQCFEPIVNPNCFQGVVDLGAIDVERGRDHGMPLYNAMRQAYGLAPKTSFTSITGESTDQLPAGLTINSPAIMDFVQLRDRKGNVIPLGSPAAQTDAVVGIRRSTLAARLKAIYGNVNRIDAFTGMVSEKHIAGTEFGELQLAIWKRQFEALRDGDRFFYLNDPALNDIQRQYGISYRRTLAQVIDSNTQFDAQGNVFKAV
ncbi:MAG TPA: peroxidase family protein [Gaiellaceae bacterium]